MPPWEVPTQQERLCLETSAKESWFSLLVVVPSHGELVSFWGRYNIQTQAKHTHLTQVSLQS